MLSARVKLSPGVRIDTSVQILPIDTKGKQAHESQTLYYPPSVRGFGRSAIFDDAIWRYAEENNWQGAVLKFPPDLAKDVVLVYSPEDAVFYGDMPTFYTSRWVGPWAAERNKLTPAEREVLDLLITENDSQPFMALIVAAKELAS